MDLELAGKVALVTGASRGIGRAIAEGLADEGARMVIAARGIEALDETQRALEATGAEFNDRGRGPDLDERYRVHWDGAAGNEDAVVQIIGNGPVATNQEHKESADWVRVKQSNIAQSK